MVTGRVEVREEVVRTGCSEAMREAVGDAYRRSSSLPRPRTPKQPPVYSVSPSPVASRHLIDLLISRLLAQVVEYAGAVDIYVTACSQT